MYYVYVLRGTKQSYVGSTNDLKRRFAEHAAGKPFATRNKGPWRLIYYEACEAERDARLREKYLKTAWGRRYLKGRLKNAA
jgi:putative endonuclease